MDKKTNKILLVIMAIGLAACSTNNRPHNENKSIANPDSLIATQIEATDQIQKTIELPYNFKIEAGRKENFGDFETYTYFILSQNNKILFKDTSLIEYEFRDTLYPKIIAIDDKTFQILVEVNDRPFKNYLKCFNIAQGKLQTVQEMPTFITTAANLDADANWELAGFRYYSEIVGSDTGELTVYNPILYYELTSKGLLLDTALTIERNKKIYGSFYGYKYNETIEFKIENCKMEEEIARIRNAKK